MILSSDGVVVKQTQAQDSTSGVAEAEEIATVAIFPALVVRRRTGADDPAAAQAEHRRVGVRGSVVLDGGVVLGDVEDVRLEHVDGGDSSRCMIRGLWIVEMVAVRGVIATLVTAVVSGNGRTAFTADKILDSLSHRIISREWCSGHSRCVGCVGGIAGHAGHRRVTGRASELLRVNHLRRGSTRQQNHRGCHPGCHESQAAMPPGRA
ncbi:MAG TPA: hypothetical protein VGO16_14035 [Pseudonocardiaceae bacterium]|nr:hypothetical protein [Pseudonocardiaceae bacterium]